MTIVSVDGERDWRETSIGTHGREIQLNCPRMDLVSRSFLSLRNLLYNVRFLFKLHVLLYIAIAIKRLKRTLNPWRGRRFIFYN